MRRKIDRAISIITAHDAKVTPQAEKSLSNWLEDDSQINVAIIEDTSQYVLEHDTDSIEVYIAVSESIDSLYDIKDELEELKKES